MLDEMSTELRPYFPTLILATLLVLDSARIIFLPHADSLTESAAWRLPILPLLLLDGFFISPALTLVVETLLRCTSAYTCGLWTNIPTRSGGWLSSASTSS